MAKKNTKAETRQQDEPKGPDREFKDTLRYNFTDAEITQIARDQGQKMREMAVLEEEKKRVSKQYAVRIEAIKGEIDADTDKIHSGYEMRMVDCGAFFDDPEPGSKRIIRFDTGETVRIDAMTQAEKQRELDLNTAEAEPEKETEKEAEAAY